MYVTLAAKSNSESPGIIAIILCVVVLLLLRRGPTAPVTWYCRFCDMVLPLL